MRASLEPLWILPKRNTWRSVQRGLLRNWVRRVSFRGNCITFVTGNAAEPSQWSLPRTSKKVKKRVSFQIGPQTVAPYWGSTSQVGTSLLPLAVISCPPSTTERPEITLIYKGEERWKQKASKRDTTPLLLLPAEGPSWEIGGGSTLKFWLLHDLHTINYWAKTVIMV